MKIPETLTVGGHNYTVIKDYKFREIMEAHGQTDHSNTEIRLCREDKSGQFSRSKYECNFIHELLHVVDNTYNNAALEEADVARLAEGLYQVLKINEMLK